MSEARSLTNFIGNGVAAIVVARWEKELDTARLRQELKQPSRVGTPAIQAASEALEAVR